jgi:anti-anti-sigma factor
VGLPLNITVKEQGTVLRLIVDGEIDLSTSQDLFTALEALSEADATVIDVDLSSVWFLDSSGIEVLVRAHRLIADRAAARQSPCRLRIVQPSGVAGAVLRASGVHGYLEIVDEAIPELTQG